MFETYRKKVQLLIQVIPFIKEVGCFALHGGTAINLFVRDMPRLSIDIDLTYVPVEDRETSLHNINVALASIKHRLEKLISGVRVQHKQDIGKLLIMFQGLDVKLEVNLVGRGTIEAPKELPLCAKAQTDFEAFVSIPVVPMSQLYGGKICAALDRQHPRDLFDVKYLLDNEGFSDEIRTGFLYCLLGSDRPIHEVIKPNFQDQRSALATQFSGMSDEEFTYEDYEAVRERLVEVVNQRLTDQDKAFLLRFKQADPDWSIYDFERFPSIQWKLRNLTTLKKTNPQKHRQQYELLKEKLG
ncbi:nucleotidyl transferase AbiEii/AbiGii toxin family protein [Runella sp. MFBS21]|uniref:nucleotidyl transferase AbiEii/AbiGii toxin family protein n=1 Tax=Runella sp. MFBS21 TaxID=3034018 RepID=UPI0023FA25A4|nr:nucleotidyl transferase AbiEii/AbiGii toxin family protein [Runella sp. MFBS21]MDF7816773.1 nucleotidyl transferase AbiEii/AbiGii toxin family protein [Runella sp. MFBS21]